MKIHTDGNLTISGYGFIPERLKEVEVKILNPLNLPLPAYATSGAAGMDLAAYIPENGTYFLRPGETKMFETGFSIQVPDGYEMQVRSRSGLAAKNSIFVLNSPGTIDSDYIGEVKVILHNAGSTSLQIKNGDRIAQMVLNRIPRFALSLAEELTKTERGTGGFGSTGL
jgi:dUTP pyrophosphatase